MKKSLLIVTLLLFVLSILAACGGGGGGQPAPAAQPAAQQPAAQPVAQGDAAKGKELFSTTCAACHGPNGEGVTGLGKPFTTSEFIPTQTDEQMLAFLKVGRPSSDPLNTTGIDMPPKGGNPALTDAQLLDIVAFIRSVHQ